MVNMIHLKKIDNDVWYMFQCKVNYCYILKCILSMSWNHGIVCYHKEIL